MNELNDFLGVGTLGAILSGIVTHYLTKRQYNRQVDKISAEVEIQELQLMKELLMMAKKEVEDQRSHRNKCEEDVKRLEIELKKLKEIVK